MSKSIQKWIEAKKKCKLSDKHIQMARELGMNPDKLGKLNNHTQEPWKAPLPMFLEELYFKQFKREAPLVIKPLAELADKRISTKNTGDSLRNGSSITLAKRGDSENRLF